MRNKKPKEWVELKEAKVENGRTGGLDGQGGSFSRFRVESLLGRGAMADVYRAHDLLTGRKVALRVIKTRMADPEMLVAERWGIELQSSASNVVPQVAKVFEHGESEGVLFAVTELVEGESLGALLQEHSGRPLPADEAIAIAVELCKLLELLQGFTAELRGKKISGIVHGDIKPSNIIVTDRYQVRILDFGVAKHLTSARGYTINIFASLPYAAPERLENLRVDSLSDLWSVAVIIYQMVSGRFPFEADAALDPSDLQRSIKQGEISPLPAEVPAELAGMVMKALRVHPEERFQTAAELRSALEQFAASEAFNRWRQAVAGSRESLERAVAAVVYDHRTGRILSTPELRERFGSQISKAASEEVASEVTVPRARLGFEELLSAIQRLDEPSRNRIAHALIEVEMDARLKHLIEQMAARASGGDITDADIDREVQAVRDEIRSA